MTAKKLLIPFVLASLTGHALVITLTTGFDWTGHPRPEEVLNVELKAPPEIVAQPDPPPREESPPEAGGERRREDVLQREKSPYDTYLLMIRRKIQRQWSQPSRALPGKKEGKPVIRFTIDAGGALKDLRVATASGSPALDEGTLAAVRAAAPFAPLPANFNLTRLHITAVFNYR